MTAAGNPRVLHADALIVGDGTTVRDGAIVVDGEGRIVELGPASEVRSRAGALPVDRLEGVLMPGVINAHTHLELSGLRGRTTLGAGFVPWLTSLQRARAEELEEERDAAIERAIAGMSELGVVAVGEVSNTLVAWGKLARRLLGTVFHEVFAIDREAGLSRVAALDAEREAMAPSAEGQRAVRYAVAPHALHSTHPDVVRALVELSRDAPLTIHLAEHAAERAFLRDGTGPWRAFLDARGLGEAAARFPIPALGPIDHARALGVLRRDAALVHLLDARPEELDRVAASFAIAVLCPRSNLAIETRLPPLVDMRARGVAIALGTDSLASAPSLDPLVEARSLADRNPEVPPAMLVAAAMSGGARAIGWGRELGVLAIGRRPGVLHVAPPRAGRLPVDVDASSWLLRNLALPRRRVCDARGDAS